MSMATSIIDGTAAAERSPAQTHQVSLTPEFSKMLTKSSPRFGTLSHHSFFSRHNPHPHRVRHIQGLNGRPVCMVRDDWYVTSSLYPHPLLKSHVLRKAPSFTFPLVQNPCGGSSNKNKSAVFSEAWREELKELAAKVTLSSHKQKTKKEEQPEDEPVRRKTQYSAATGRIIPASAKSHQRRSHSQHLMYHEPFHDQELMVLELLCQILQTDSLSTVQQWLLLAGQRERELVMGMIKQALDGVELTANHQPAFNPGAYPPVYNPPSNQSWRKPRRASSYLVKQTSDNDKPERIGDAEVLEIHTEDYSRPKHSA